MDNKNVAEGGKRTSATFITLPNSELPRLLFVFFLRWTASTPKNCAALSTPRV